MINKCPKCGGISGFEMNDYGNILNYFGCWGDSEMECIEIKNTLPAPKYVRCIDCGKLIKKKIALNKDK